MVPAEEVLPLAQQRKNIWLLALAQALAGANAVVVFATGAIVGNMLAPSSVLATLPISIFVVGMAVSILPYGYLAKNHGRKIAFYTGTGAGVMAGLLALVAMLQSGFWLFCCSTFFAGAYAAVVLTYRFAAAEGVEPERRAQALSMVMAGGVLAGIIGPQLVTSTMHLGSDTLFAATFLVQSLVAALSGVLLIGVKVPKPVALAHSGGRPLFEIARQPVFLAAVVCGAAAYLVMNFLMTAAPLAMQMNGHSLENSNLGIQWHVIAMYAPSFFTGRLITRFGAVLVALAGLLITAASALVGLMGLGLMHFWLMLILLGVGWNFGFLGASALVLESYQTNESTRVQALNDFIIFGLMALGSFASGGILNAYGWDRVLILSLLPVGLAMLFFLVVRASTRRTD